VLTSEHPLETVALVAHKTAGDRHGTCALIGELGGSRHWGEKVEENKERRRKKCVIIMDGPCVYILENNPIMV